jgi:hypothetical protein
MTVTNSPAYYGLELITVVKSFIVKTSRLVLMLQNFFFVIDSLAK